MTDWMGPLAPGVNDNVTLESGMVRSSTEGKVNPLLVRDGPMFMRWAWHLTKAVASKGKRNWMNARSDDDLERFLEAFSRHAEQWLDDVRAHRAGRPTSGEDHAAALIFNVNGAEYVLERIASNQGS